MRQLTNLMLDELHVLLDLIHESIMVIELSARGQKCLGTYHDLMHVLLIALEHGGAKAFFAIYFKRSFPTFEQTLNLIICAIVGDLENNIVVRAHD